MKKILFLFAFICGVVFNSTSQTFEVSGINYNVVSAVSPFTVEVTAKTVKYTGAIDIPSQVVFNNTTYSVTKIGSWAFSSCTQLTSITMPNSVLYIDNSAFNGCSGLTNVVFSTSLQGILAYAFSGCTSLAQLSLPNSLIYMSTGAFGGCTSLTTVTIPASTTNVFQGVFEYCANLTSFVVANGNTAYKTVNGALLTMDGFTLIQCPAGLTSYTIPSSVKTLAYGAFGGCGKLTSITLPSTITTIENNAFRYCTQLTSVILPSTLTTVASASFAFCSKLESVTIPNGVKSIESIAFGDCSSLKTINIPSSVTSIGSGSFQNDSTLTSIYCNAITPPVIADQYVFTKVSRTIPLYVPAGSEAAYKAAAYWNEFTNTLAIPNEFVDNGIKYSITSNVEPYTVAVIANSPKYSGSITIPSQVVFNNTTYSVTKIGSWAFSSCTQLTSITMPNSVIYVDNSAFNGCSGLTNVVFSTSLQGILAYAFSGCTSLAQLSLPNSLIYMSTGAFGGCTSLTTVTIPASTTNVFQGVFESCSNLTSFVVAIGNTAYKTVNGALLTKDGFTLIQCPAGLSSYTIPSSVKTLAYGAFGGCGKLTAITLPSTITTIENNAFRYCTQLTSVILPSTLTTVASASFAFCSKLASVTIPNGVKSIESIAFGNCSSLKTINIPASVTSIGSGAFQLDSTLTSIYCNAVTPPAIANQYVFTKVSRTIPLYVPKGSEAAYKAADYWKEFTNVNPANTALIESEIMDVIISNPISTVLRIYNLEPASLVELFNAEGNILIKEKVDSSEAEFNVESLSKGIYIVRVTKSSQAKSFRVVKN